MVELILFSLVVYGISNIVVYSSLFEKPRELFNRINPSFLGKLVSCMMCFPTWVGFLVSYAFYYFGFQELTPCGSWGITLPWLVIFLDGMIASATSWLLNTIQEYFEYNTPQD